MYQNNKLRSNSSKQLVIFFSVEFQTGKEKGTDTLRKVSPQKNPQRVTPDGAKIRF